MYFDLLIAIDRVNHVNSLLKLKNIISDTKAVKKSFLTKHMKRITNNQQKNQINPSVEGGKRDVSHGSNMELLLCIIYIITSIHRLVCK